MNWIDDINCIHLEYISIFGDTEQVLRYCKYYEYEVTEDECRECTMREEDHVVVD
jgi:hypothetical protein